MPSEPPTGNGAGVEFFKQEAGVFAFAPDVALGAGVVPAVEPGPGVAGATVGGVVVPAPGAGVEPELGAVEIAFGPPGVDPTVVPPPQPVTMTAAKKHQSTT
jgi:hypothetical protein